MSKNLRKNTWSLNENYAEVEAGKIGYSDDAGGHKLYAWGFNEYAGQLGQNDVENRSSPVQIGSATDWSKQCVSAGAPSNRPHCYAVKTNGSLYGWGKNGDGQLAQNNEVPYYSSPVQIPGTTWSTERGKLSPGGYGDIAAVKTDGSLWTWGNNSRGRLGHNDKYAQDVISPRQVGTDLNWEFVSVNQYTVAGTKQDGTMWMWGGGIHGLGQGYADDWESSKSSPVQVPGFGWSLGEQACQSSVRAVKSVNQGAML